jgi:beta-galactosidase/beta-glucuronidase
MKRDYNAPKNFEDFVYVSQLLQAEGMRTGFEAHRRNKPYCMGTLYWQLNDVWPVASWSEYRLFWSLESPALLRPRGIQSRGGPADFGGQCVENLWGKRPGRQC